jgi:hypothetical protein
VRPERGRRRLGREKAAGEGPDIITGTKEDLKAVEAEKAAKPKILDLNDVE